MSRLYTQERLISFSNEPSIHLDPSSGSVSGYSNLGVLQTSGEVSFPSNIIGCSLSIKGFSLEIDVAGGADPFYFGYEIKDKNIIGPTVIFSVAASYLADPNIKNGSRLNRSGTWIEISAVAQCE